MSRHSFTTTREGRGVTVVMGWDRALRYYFMFVEQAELATAEASEVHVGESDTEDEYLYSNINEVDAFDKDLDYYDDKLKELGIKVPWTMFEQVWLDGLLGAGNRIVVYQTDGSFHER